MRIHAGQLDYQWYVTEEAVYLPGATERQLYNHHYVTQGMHKANHPGSQHQLYAPLQAHNARVVEWFADDSIMAIATRSTISPAAMK
jgi:hypothetical protein